MTDKETQKGKVSVSGLSRNLVFWFLVFLIMVMGWQMVERNREPVEPISYSEFQKYLLRNDIQSVTVDRDKFVTGEFKRAIKVTARPVQNFETTLPFESSADFVATLEERGVEVTGEEPKQGFGTFLLGLLPWMILMKVTTTRTVSSSRSEQMYSLIISEPPIF